MMTSSSDEMEEAPPGSRPLPKPVPLLSAIRSEGPGRSAPASRCYCLGRTVYKKFNPVLDGGNMSICMLRYIDKGREPGGVSNPIVNSEEFNNQNPYPMGNDMMASSSQNDPAGVGTSAAGNIGNWNAFQSTSSAGLHPEHVPRVPIYQTRWREIMPTGLRGGVPVPPQESNLPLVDHGAGIIPPSNDTESLGEMEELDDTCPPPVITENPRKQRILKKDAKAMPKLWLSQLCSFPGVNKEKAVAISKVFEGPKELFDAYRGCSPEIGRNLLTNIPYTLGLGRSTRTETVGLVVSENIYELFTAAPPSEIIPEVEEME